MQANNRIGSLDFIKGVAIFFVLLLHTIPQSVLTKTGECFHLGQAVPLFLFVSLYLGFKGLDTKGSIYDYYTWGRIKRMLVRLWLPLMVLAIPQALFFYLQGNTERALGALLCLSNGPGSYFVWCYTQLWFLIPLIYLLIRRTGALWGGANLLIGSFLVVFIWGKISVFNPGICCARYLFLSIVAYLFLRKVSVKRVWPLVIISVLYLAFISTKSLPMWAQSFMPKSWEAQTSFAFFYTYFVVLVLLGLYQQINSTFLAKWLNYIGECSWEIFLAQMFLLGTGWSKVVMFFSRNEYVQVLLLVVLTSIVSITLGLLFHKLVKRI